MLKMHLSLKICDDQYLVTAEEFCSNLCIETTLTCGQQTLQAFARVLLTARDAVDLVDNY
jgi:hypothetical protein